MPKRIQLSRAKGWRKPRGAVKVDRSTNWGNPYAARDYGGNCSAQLLVDLFRDMVTKAPDGKGQMIREELHKLRGKDLACWCPLDQPCHADVLLELANKEPTP